MNSNNFDKNMNLLENRLKKRHDEVESALKEVTLLLNNDTKLIESLIYCSVMIFSRNNLEQIQLEQDTLRKAKALNNKISKKAFQLYQLMKELDELGDTPIEAEWNFPFLHSLQIIQDASEFSYLLQRYKSVAVNQKKLYEESLGETVTNLLEQGEPDEYCPHPMYIIYAIGKSHQSHEFKKIHRQASPRTLLRELLNILFFLVKTGSIPKEILNISCKSMTDIINVALDLSVDNLFDERSVRGVFSELFEIRKTELKK